MKLIKIIFPLFLLQALFAEIVEIKYVSEMEKYIKDNTVVIFDIDNTIMEPVQEMGNDQWFHHRYEHHKKTCSRDEAHHRALFEWTAVRYLTDMQLVEPHVASMIQDLQNKGKTVFALTTQSPGLSPRTIYQLNSFGIHFEKNPPSKDEIVLQKDGSVLYRLGILFTSGRDKGDAFQRLLEHIPKPKHVIFINDKESHIQPVEEACKKLKIHFVGLRYGYLDEKVKNFRPDIADFQFEQLCNFLSDQQAEEKLFSSQKSVVENDG